MSKIDKILEAGALLDWLTPIRSVIDQDIRGKTSICVGTWEQMNAVEAAGIQVTKRTCRGNRWTFDVPRDQEKQTRRIMKG